MLPPNVETPRGASPEAATPNEGRRDPRRKLVRKGPSFLPRRRLTGRLYIGGSRPPIQNPWLTALPSPLHAPPADPPVPWRAARRLSPPFRGLFRRRAPRLRPDAGGRPPPSSPARLRREARRPRRAPAPPSPRPPRFSGAASRPRAPRARGGPPPPPRGAGGAPSPPFFHP